MNLNTLTAISPLDGRYRRQVEELATFFSEYGLIRYRVQVEIEYFLALYDIGLVQVDDANQLTKLTEIYEHFTEEDALRIKEIEQTTNHDVKAVEYFLKEKMEQRSLGDSAEWIHFGLTSQDINNTATPLLWKDALEQYYLPAIINLSKKIHKLASAWQAIPLLARTHGQAASPTTLGKEFMVFVERIERQIELLSYIPYTAKFGGATGNFNAHFVAFPDIDWIQFANEFVTDRLGLERIQFTTQIEPYDHLAAHSDNIKRLNNILIDLCRDIWSYISVDYFKQRTKEGEIGSSAMPHKVNPIDFENAEGNLGIANALFEHLSAKLPISRLQRDLTDSTVLRNLGVPLAHTYLAIKAIEKGLDKLIVNEDKINYDLDQNWAVTAEAIQTVLRRVGYPKPYEALKELTRGKGGITKASIAAFIQSLDVSEDVKQELLLITPHNYIGVPFTY